MMSGAVLAQALAIVAVLAALVVIPDPPGSGARKRRGLSRRGALLLASMAVARSAGDEIRGVAERGPVAERRSGERSSRVIVAERVAER